jgi:hypothetical protein
MVVQENMLLHSLISYVHVESLSSSATQDWFSSLAPYGPADKGSSPVLWISIIEQLFSSIHALYLTLSRLAETCILRWSGYIDKVGAN